MKLKQITRNLLLIGAGNSGRKVINKLVNDNRSYYKIAGILDDNPRLIGKQINDIGIISSIDEVSNVVKTFGIDDILISISNINYSRLLEIIENCKKTGKSVHVKSKLVNVISDRLLVERIGSLSSFQIRTKGISNFYKLCKRFIDLLISFCFIIVFLPFWILIGIIINLTSNGPIFYKATVVGKNENFFSWYKFRTMRMNNDDQIHRDRIKEVIKKDLPALKLSNDDRITGIGKFLRKYSIDEFPQVLNVIKGEMSLVGPRPKLPYEYELMESWQKRRFSITPGITGIWQIKGRDELKFVDEIVFDLYYIENMSLKLDIEILLKTVPVVLFGNGGK